MTTPRILVNFRLAGELITAIDAAASRAGLNRTEWVTSTLTLAARAELEGRAMAVAAGVPASEFTAPEWSGTRVVIDGCAHPKSARGWLGEGLVCMLCRTVLERRRQGA